MDYKTVTREKSLSYKNSTVLSYRFDYPIFQNALISKRVNRVTYSSVEKRIKSSEGNMFKSACKRYDILEKYNNFTESKITGNYQIMFNSSNLLSWFADYYIDMAEDGKFIERTAQNWDLKSGVLLNFENLFYRNTDWLLRCMTVLEDSILKLEEEIGVHCNPKWREYALQSMKKGRFYLTDDGIALWFTHGSIASNIWCLPTVHLKVSCLEGVINKKYLNN